MIYKLFSIAFFFLMPLFSYILVSFFILQLFWILFTYLSFPLFALYIALLAIQSLTLDVFFYYLICLSLLALILSITFLKRYHAFSYRRFLKFFWRSGFILTAIFYVIELILVFTIGR